MRFAAKLAVVAVLAVLTGVTTAETLSYSDLVGRLTDMKRLATMPEPGVTSGNFSSWDRGARYDEASGKYVAWWANNDGGGFMDNEGTMMKMDGPGVIWRIWSAKPERGNVEFYIDSDEKGGSEKPTVVMPFIDMFTKEPYSKYPELVHMKARGQNCFIPIPFQKSIRIRGDRGWGRYYQITYTKFPEGTKVPSFTGKFSDEDKKALAKANEIWGKRGPDMFVTDAAETTQKTVTVKPGEEVAIAEYAKPGAIVSITMDRPKIDRAASIDILRELAISIRWDGEKEPSVWAPLGDFFGTGAGENLYRTMVTGMTDAKYYANWYMPFEKAKVTVRNDGDKPRELTFTIHTEKVADAKDLLRYHCKWQRDDFSGFDEERFLADRWPDWPVVKIDGTAGRFCGFHMHVWNPLHLWNGGLKNNHLRPFPKSDFLAPGTPAHRFYNGAVRNNYWWGEGDEKFFVDGEKMPSTFGTGSEDYFGYAWGTSQAFDSGLQAQPLNGGADEIGKTANNRGPGNIGHICNLRWQVADDVPFQKSFEAAIEKYHPNNWPLLNAMTASWYQEPGKPDYYRAKPIDQRKDYYVAPKPLPPTPVVEGRYEAENRSHVKPVAAPGTHMFYQPMRHFGQGWSGHSQITWRHVKPKQTLTLTFDVKEDTQGIALALTVAPDYGIFKILLDGKELGKAVDLYGPKVARIDEIRFNDVKLSKGSHTVTIQEDGKNEKSKGNLFGIDYIKVGK